ncbi:sugar phosphate nucleotidyltransferase [Clostridium sp. Marseille-P2415]|uniref:sugar phosphate nucleotidyltransferase n=1 Tax=Clostridium sp. Marseille-P2415 TaxID=1805471 RepID=UPI0009885BBD|nr:sugar phosphate nucleotidyltransferase [Clostridium sp. Marseille-P2415]
MNIILLSGGSGKRLWPLSNDVHSKQFIKLFKDDNGEYESMVQRVYRQITTVDCDARITIATSKSQASAIKNQLGEKASICVEPCRRDTFPAIVLAAAYLQDELHIGSEEAVVVCPVDPYVDNTYYEAVKTLQELAEHGEANLTLMGIEPTYPSEKYGYIIPESGDNVSRVKEFKEKPATDTAKKYLDQKALWNAGIFAFRLGYLLDKAHSMIEFEDYRDLFSKYDTLTKISFDYAVVERETSIQVLRYSGDWKDVGTWNMMAEVMADKTKGRAILDETCENTNVVNELNIPILCMGCKGLIVAASGDGILISDRERSGYMKPYVEKIETEAMYAEKSWGSYTVIDVQPGSMTVKVSMKVGERMSYHMHNYREEVWTVVSGKGKAVVDGMEQILRTGDVITIAAGCKHTVEAITAIDIVEVQLGDEISVNDKIKFSME